MIPDDNERIKECDLQYPVEIKKKRSIVPLSNKSRYRVVYT